MKKTTKGPEEVAAPDLEPAKEKEPIAPPFSPPELAEVVQPELAEVVQPELAEPVVTPELAEPVVTPEDPPPPEGPSVHSEPDHPIGSAEGARANGLGELGAAAYAAHFRKLRSEGASELEAHVAAAEKASDERLEFRAKSVLRNEEAIVLPGEKVDHLSGPELLDLLSRDAVELV